jgi:hypothetical protein
VNLATISASRVTSLNVVRLGDEAASIKHKETEKQYCEMLRKGTTRFASRSAYLWLAKQMVLPFNRKI